MTTIVPVKNPKGQDKNYEIRLKCMERLTAVLDNYSVDIAVPVIMDMLCSGIMEVAGCGNDPVKFRDIKGSLNNWMEMWINSGAL